MFGSERPDYAFRMTRCGRILALFFGLWLALAPAIIAVPAAAMSIPMSTCDDADAGDCDACPDADVDREVCAFICLSAAQFALPAEKFRLDAVFGDGHRRGNGPPPSGRLSTPEPAPPKLHSLL